MWWSVYVNSLHRYSTCAHIAWGVNNPKRLPSPVRVQTVGSGWTSQERPKTQKGNARTRPPSQLSLSQVSPSWLQHWSQHLIYSSELHSQLSSAAGGFSLLPCYLIKYFSSSSKSIANSADIRHFPQLPCPSLSERRIQPAVMYNPYQSMPTMRNSQDLIPHCARY